MRNAEEMPGQKKERGSKPPQPQKKPKHQPQRKEVKKEIKKEVKKEVKKETTGPKKQFSVSVTAALGYITGNKDHGPDLKLNVFLHPSLCKSPDEQSAFGPLQAAAAQYGLWRCSKAHIKFTPLVGSSAVSGTVIRASANLTQTPSSTSWGGLGARKHRDLQAGRAGAFILTRRDLAGPRDGGWWLTDTNNEGAQAAGPIVEAHALGQTMSTYKDEPWSAELFIVELTGTWEFANYTMNPAMGSLERHDADAPIKILTDAEGKLQLEVASASTLARFMDDPTARAPRAGSTTGETIFQVVDTAASAISSLVPPPFGWLLKGGWWFVKKLAGRTRAGEERFQIYASLTDAQNERPVITTLASTTGKEVTGPLQVTQLNAPNLGGSAPSVVSASVPGPVFPVAPSDPPNSGHVVLFGKFYKVYKPLSLPNLPPPFVDNVIRVGDQTFYATVFRIDQYRALAPNAAGLILAYSTRLNYRINPTPLLVLPAASQSSGTETPFHPALYGSNQVANSVWHSYVVGTNVASTDHWKSGQKDSYYLREAQAGPYKLISEPLTHQGFDVQTTMALNQGLWLISFLTDKEFRPGVTGYRSPTLPAELADSAKTGAFALQLMGGNNPNEFDFSIRTSVWPETGQAAAKLAECLGIELSTLRDALGDLVTPVPDGADTDTDDDEEYSMSDDFERLPEQPNPSQPYLNLRDAGLSHEQALEVLRANNPLGSPCGPVTR